MVVSNILDPIHDVVDPTVWDAPTEHYPVLKPQHRDWILDRVLSTLKAHGYGDMDKWLDLYLTGSLTTFQYSDESDCDISVFVNTDVFPEWSRAEMIGVMVDEIDGTTLPGTTHPMQCFVVPSGLRPNDLYKPGLRSGYNIQANQWAVPPERDRVHDVQNEQNADYVYALECADKMERLLRYEPDKAVTFWHQIHERRRRDQKLGKGDYSQSNIVYKFLNNRGLFPQISDASGEYIAKTGAFRTKEEWQAQRGKNWNHGLTPDLITHHEGTVPGVGTTQHRPVLWYDVSRQLATGQPGATHAQLREEMAAKGVEQREKEAQEHLFSHMQYSKGAPDPEHYGVITPNNELMWYASWDDLNDEFHDQNRGGEAINQLLGTTPRSTYSPEQMEGACSVCGGTGMDQDSTYYHEGLNGCEACGGTGRAAAPGWGDHFAKTARLLPAPERVELARQRLNLEKPVRFMPTYRGVRGGYAGVSRDPQTGQDSHLIYFDPRQNPGAKNWAAWHELAHAAQNERGSAFQPTDQMSEAEYQETPKEAEAEAIASQYADLDLFKTAADKARVLYNKFRPEMHHPPTRPSTGEADMPFIYDPDDDIVHLGPPNSFHWELIQRTPELKAQYPMDLAYREFSALSVPKHLHGRMSWPSKLTDFMGLTDQNSVHQDRVNEALGATRRPDDNWSAFANTNPEGQHVGQDAQFTSQPPSEEAWSLC